MVLSAQNIPVNTSGVIASEVIAGEMIIVVAPDRPLRTEFVASLTAILPKNSLSHIVTPDEFSNIDLENTGFVVALGGVSLQAVRQRKIKLPVIASYISALSYQPDAIRSVSESVLFPTANIGVQMRLAGRLLPQVRTVGILISPEFQKNIPEIASYAKRYGYALEVAIWDGKENLPRLLNKLLKEADYLLAIEDPNVFNRNTIKSILLTSYRKNKVVIGPNISYVATGSLATTWCSTDDIAKAVINTIEYFKLKQHLPESSDFFCYSVKVNEQVAKSLSITIPEDIMTGKFIVEEENK